MASSYAAWAVIGLGLVALLPLAWISRQILLWRVASYLDDTRGVLEVHAYSRRWCIVVERGSGRVDWDRVVRAEAWLLRLGLRGLVVKNLTANETFHELSVHLHGPKAKPLADQQSPRKPGGGG